MVNAEVSVAGWSIFSSGVGISVEYETSPESEFQWSRDSFGAPTWAYVPYGRLPNVVGPTRKVTVIKRSIPEERPAGDRSRGRIAGAAAGCRWGGLDSESDEQPL